MRHAACGVHRQIDRPGFRRVKGWASWRTALLTALILEAVHSPTLIYFLV
jgi:hypothetical protein